MTGQPPPGVVTGRPIAEQRAHDAALATVAAVEAAREATPCPTLTVLRGLPGSGKTTLARELRDDARNRAGRPGTLVVISRDDIRQHLIGLSMAPDDAVLDRAGEALVTAIETAIVDACLAAAGVDVVVDATHLDRSHLERTWPRACTAPSSTSGTSTSPSKSASDATLPAQQLADGTSVRTSSAGWPPPPRRRTRSPGDGRPVGCRRLRRPRRPAGREGRGVVMGRSQRVALNVAVLTLAAIPTVGALVVRLVTP